MVLRTASLVGFYAAISEPRIDGTYMTFLVTLSNLRFALSSSTTLYVANWVSKRYAYVIAATVGITLGSMWLGLSLKTLRRLQSLPTSKWYLMPETNTNDMINSKQQDEKDREMPFISNSEKD